MTVYSSYTPNFKCATDGNGKGLVNSNIGLITYDEVVYVGGYPYKDNSSYYLYNNLSSWTMSPAGVSGIPYAFNWLFASSGYPQSAAVSSKDCLRVVLNLNANTTVTGSGTSTDPYVVE